MFKYGDKASIGMHMIDFSTSSIYDLVIFSNNNADRSAKIYLNGNILQYQKKTKLLGAILDSKLTIKDHCQHILNEGKCRLLQLQSVSNCCFGPSQTSLRNIYIAYIRSILIILLQFGIHFSL